jgi:[ribosomal protein S18]-alanine N-acetyltransferase
MSAIARAQDEIFVPLSPARLDEVIAIENDVYPYPWTLGNFEDALRAGNTAWSLLDRQDRIIAYAVAMMAVDEAHLLNLSVAARYQRRGFGWRMLEWIAHRTRDYGARSLLLEVRPSNEAALRLYRRYGFEQIGLRIGYYPAPLGREDAVVMRIAL